MRSQVHLFWALFFVAGVLVNDVHAEQQQQLPDLGAASAHVLSPHQEKQIGEIVLLNLRRGPLTKDPIIKYFVESHLQGIAQYSDLRDFNLKLVTVESKQLNAFAIPGGVIGINLGLILSAQDVHEYSSVIAHELAHLSQRHHARSMQQQSNLVVQNLVGFIASAVLIAAGGTEPGFATIMGTEALVQGQALAFSRSHEIEADRVGFNTLVKAGYDPFGATRMFERMHQKYRYQRALPEYFSTHPLTVNRIADMRSEAEKLTIETKEYQPSKDYQNLRSKIKVLAAEAPADAIAVAEDETDPYGLAYAYSRDNQHELAVEQMSRAYSESENSIFLAASYAEILMDAEKAQEALDLLDKWLFDYPDHTLLSLLKCDALKRLNRVEESVKILSKQAQLNKTDHDIWFKLAEHAGMIDNLTVAYRARAEYHALRGEFDDSLRQLQHAKRLAGDNFRLNATLDQRILDLREYAAALE
ncbi:MAG: M48 family metalloprotease [Gammaproteobacteria bacterium]|nr:M48 family metalloprotease [Gammaproteobacteria bacterium]